MGCQPKDTCHDTSRQPADQWPVVDNLFVIAGWNFGYSPEWKPGKKDQGSQQSHRSEVFGNGSMGKVIHLIQHPYG